MRGYNLIYFSNKHIKTMVEANERGRIWPKADNKLTKEIMELLNQATH